MVDVKGNRKARVLLYDLETTPLVSYTWGMYQQNVIALKRDWELLSVAYKWLGEKKVRCVARPDLPSPSSDKNLTSFLWSLLNEADVVVAHNGNSFDNKKAEAKFIQHGLQPPTPYQTVDTKREAKKYFRFTSNRLDALGELLGVGRKEKTGGFELWLDCMKDMGRMTKAWRTMKKYNRQDVALLERVYLKLLPWMNSHPHMGRLEGLLDGCPKCGSSRLKSYGWRHTRAYSYRRFRCLNCGGFTHERASEKLQGKTRFA